MNELKTIAKREVKITAGGAGKARKKQVDRAKVITPPISNGPQVLCSQRVRRML